MNKFIYLIGVVFVSFEAIIIALSICAYCLWNEGISNFSKGLTINSEALKVLMAIPLALAVWIISETRQMVFENDSTTKLLKHWADYSKFKYHIFVAIGYAVTFVLISLVPWFIKDGIKSGLGFSAFVVSIVGQLIVAATVYFARFSVREILSDAPKL